MKHNVLITGGGGDLAWSILRSLQASGLPLRFLGADCNPDSVGVYFFDEFYLLPPASSPHYAAALENICRREQVHILYPASDGELPVLARLAEQLFQETGARIATHPLPVVQLLRDKLETNRFLVRCGLPAPRTLDLDSAQEADIREVVSALGWPLVLKPAVSHGSRGMHLVESVEEIQFYRSKIERPILQEFIGPPESEYTCGIYVTAGSELRLIVLRRKLFGGVTGIAEKVESEEISEYCRAVVRALGIRGALNIQLRTGPRGPLLFEINPRFSSTACIRAHFGFNDALWAFEERLCGSLSAYQPTGESYCFRYLQEYYCPVGPKRLPKQPDFTSGASQ